MEHFLAICCFGGEPFLDFHLNSTKIDPTDWSADVLKDLSENSTWIPNSIDVPLSKCAVFNITFSNFPDQILFDSYKADFECRCPEFRSGPNCQFEHQSALPLTSPAEISSVPYPMLLVLAAVVLAFMGILMMMVRGCFFDCFGPLSREDPYDKPLDPEDVRKCLQKVKENQARREMASEPLVQQCVPPPLVSESYSAPYSGAPPSAPPMHRPSSPPPAYCDIDRNPANCRTTQI